MIFTKVGPQTQKLIKTLPKGQVLNCKNLKLKVRMNDRSHHHCPKDAHPMYCTKLPNQLGNFGSRVFSLPFCIPCYLTVSSARLTQKPKVLRTLWRWYCDSSEGEGPHDRFMRRFSSRWVVGVDSTDGRSGGLWPTGLRNAFFRKTQAGLVGGSQIFFFFWNSFRTKTPLEVVLDIIFSWVIRSYDSTRWFQGCVFVITKDPWSRRVQLNTARHWDLPGIWKYLSLHEIQLITTFCLSSTEMIFARWKPLILVCTSACFLNIFLVGTVLFLCA